MGSAPRGSTLSVLRWALGVYRNVLADVSPQRCRQVDELIARTGRAIRPTTVHMERLEDDDLLDPMQSAEVLNITKRTLDEHRRTGKLKGVLVGRKYCYRVGELRRYLVARSSATVDTPCRVIADGESLPEDRQTR